MLKNADAFQQLNAVARATNILEVFVDDFVAVSNQLQYLHLEHVSNYIINGIHSIFPPPEVSLNQGEYPVSQQNLQLGDGTWAFTKEIQG